MKKFSGALPPLKNPKSKNGTKLVKNGTKLVKKIITLYSKYNGKLYMPTMWILY